VQCCTCTVDAIVQLHVEENPQLRLLVAASSLCKAAAGPVALAAMLGQKRTFKGSIIGAVCLAEATTPPTAPISIVHLVRKASAAARRMLPVSQLGTRL
jgi:hypothetical protein